MKITAVYPGSFDPITIGHLDIIQRVARIFDEVIVLVAESDRKEYMFAVDERVELIRSVLKKDLPDVKNVQVDRHIGLTTEYMAKKKANVIVRGLRAVADFEYEGTLANMNKRLSPDVETFMIFSKPEYYYISSRGVKEIARNGGPLTGLVPDVLIPAIQSRSFPKLVK